MSHPNRLHHPATLSPSRRWAALAVLLFPVLLVSVDNTVLSFAIPAISTALSPSGDQLLWIIDVYPLVLAGLLIPMGSLGDRIGRRRLLLAGSTGFALVSALAAFASDAGQLIAARVLLGAFGAMLMPATLSLIRNIFTDPVQRRTAIAIWAAAFSGGAVLGPVIGGLLLQHFWWGSVFLLAVPMLLPLLAGGLLLPESRDPNPGRVDVVSMLLAIMTLLPFAYGIKSIGAGPWYLPALAMTLGAACGVAFVRRQLASPTPMLEVRLFANRIFSGALAVNLLGIFSLVGFIYFASQHLQLVSGLTPFEAGLWMTPGLALTMVFGLLAVRLAARFGACNVMIAGLVLSAIAYGIVVAAGVLGNDAWLMLAFCVLGLGVGMSETLSNDLVLSEVPPAKAGAASAISETAYEVGSVLGIAVLGTILNGMYAAALRVPGSLSTAQAEQATQTLAGAHVVAQAMPAPEGALLLQAAAHAFDRGVLVTASLAAVLALVAAGIVFRVVKPVAR